MRLISLPGWLIHPSTTFERNLRAVLVDGIGVGIVVGIGTFLSVFLARLGASSFLVGLLHSLPALTGAMFAVPVGRFLERRKNIVPWYSNARIWVQLSYAVFGLLPFVLPVDAIPVTVIAIWALVTIPATLVNVAFTLVMSAVAGPEHRFFLMSRRWSTLGFVSAVAVALAGLVLERVAFPLNYQVVFLASSAGGMLSYAYSRSIRVPDNPHRGMQRNQPATDQPGIRPTSMITSLRSHPSFLSFVVSAFVFRAGVAMALPLFPLYWVKVVSASDAWIGAITMINNAVLLVAYYVWASYARRHGNGRVILISSVAMSCYPVLTAITPIVWPLAIYAGLAGFFAAGNDLVMFDLLISRCPKHQQATSVGFYHTTQNTALFLMPLLGTMIADTFGLTAALLVAGALRLTGSGLFAILGVTRDARSAPAVSPASPLD